MCSTFNLCYATLQKRCSKNDQTLAWDAEEEEEGAKNENTRNTALRQVLCELKVWTPTKRVVDVQEDRKKRAKSGVSGN